MNRRRNGFPPASKPRKTSGGIKAQSKRGAFGERWWAKQWIGVLEGFGLGTRLARGRTYARQGQVIEIAIESGAVRAKVQGSRKNPYNVTMAIEPLTVAQWCAVAEAISQTPRFAALLLNGEMPQDIEGAFTAARCDLFPRSIADLRTACSCPDWSNPCKHVAAVYYLIGEEFDRDPFLLFALRGLERDALLRELRLEGDAPVETPCFVTGSEPRGPAPRPAVEPPPVDAWLLRRAGRLPFWHGGVTLEEALLVVYAKAAEAAATLLTQTWPDAD
jgi:uncharacterized Zn finger protein